CFDIPQNWFDNHYTTTFVLGALKTPNISSELDVVNGLGDKTNGNRIGYEEYVLEKPQYLKKEDQSRGGIPQQNAETLRDFQATSRGKASSSVVGPQKIEAFTGSIVEHTHNLETNTLGKMQPSGSQPSKPVSRFKAQRR
uniref:Uncharacterized protein n=1 Tax=Brassica oleracea var. oleracea TaxID=109376 RepID=A0A0D3C575_BRAOL